MVRNIADFVIKSQFVDECPPGLSKCLSFMSRGDFRVLSTFYRPLREGGGEESLQSFAVFCQI